MPFLRRPIRPVQGQHGPKSRRAFELQAHSIGPQPHLNRAPLQKQSPRTVPFDPTAGSREPRQKPVLPHLVPGHHRPGPQHRDPRRRRIGQEGRSSESAALEPRKDRDPGFGTMPKQPRGEFRLQSPQHGLARGSEPSHRVESVRRPRRRLGRGGRRLEFGLRVACFPDRAIGGSRITPPAPHDGAQQHDRPGDPESSRKSPPALDIAVHREAFPSRRAKASSTETNPATCASVCALETANRKNRAAGPLGYRIWGG